MIRKIKSNLKSLNRKESSLLDFVKEVRESKPLKTRRITQTSVTRKSRKDENQISTEKLKVLNGHLLSSLNGAKRKIFAEDSHNIKRNDEKTTTNAAIKDYFKPSNLIHSVKVYQAEFFDEFNQTYVNMPKYLEKDIKFTQSEILPPVKVMTLDNDVMTDPEQLDDASEMMKNNLLEAIKLIKGNKNYLNKNLSRKIQFIKNDSVC
jgi:hypothetical protein